MLILTTPSTLSQGIQQTLKKRDQKASTKATASNKVTMFAAVYNICVICIVETLKMLSTAMTKSARDASSRAVDRKIDVTPKLSRRSNSKVVYVQRIKVDPAWLQQVSRKQRPQPVRNSSPEPILKSADAAAVSASKMASTRHRVRHLTFPGCHRSASLHSLFSRRRSFPLANSLNVIMEEDEQQLS
jgi:hypothetical protein